MKKFVSLLTDLGLKDPQGIVDLVGETRLTEVLSKMLQTLGEKKSQICHAYYGIGQEEQSRKEIGESHGVSASRIGQHIRKSCTRLRHVSRMDMLSAVIEEMRWKKSSPEVQELHLRVQSVEAQVASLTKQLLRACGTIEDLKDPLGKMPIQDLELTVRTTNCLIADDIRTVRDLCKRSEAELLRTPNLGKKCFAEIKEVLAYKGLALTPSLEA